MSSERVRFVCPHCGERLEADSRDDGMTAPCPACNGQVTLEVMTTKKVVGATLLGVGLGILAAFFDS